MASQVPPELLRQGEQQQDEKSVRRHSMFSKEVSKCIPESKNIIAKSWKHGSNATL
jgi:hypothetical protein